MTGAGDTTGDHHDEFRCIIAQCTDEKRDGKHQAKELYMPSRLFRAQRRYCEAYADLWLIVSGKHGLVHPESAVSSYNVPVDDDSWTERTQEAVDGFFRRAKADGIRILHPDGRHSGNLSVLGPTDEIHFELLCGEDYLKRLEPYLEYHDLDYSLPFEGQRYGVRCNNMLDAARRVENDSLEAFI